MKFRKKPIMVEAVDWANTEQEEYPVWLKDAINQGDAWFSTLRTLRIQTEEGVMTANSGDYIIQGVGGEIYPCKPDIFTKTYEAVNDPI